MNEYYYKSGYDLSWIDVTRSSIARYEAGLRRCFKQAIDAGETWGSQQQRERLEGGGGRKLGGQAGVSAGSLFLYWAALHSSVAQALMFACY